MEAPTVNQIQSKNIKINSENRDYDLTISYTINLTIKINCTNTKERYENQYTFEQILKLNRYFLMCESIKDIYDELSILIDNQKINISYSNNDIILKIPLPSQKIKEVEFILKPTKKSTADELNDLKQLLNEQNEIIKQQNIKITNHESEIKILKNQILKINQLEKKILDLESILNSNKENINKLKNNTDETIQKLKKIIGRECNLQLLYQMTKDGDKCETFHKKVDNQGPTITLFKSEDGYKFGGYTSQSFGASNGEKWITDSDAFLFNFNTSNKYYIKNQNSQAIFLGGNGYGPEFYDILVNCGNIKIAEIRVGNFINKQEDLKRGNCKFNNNDVLVYKVDFI